MRRPARVRIHSLYPADRASPPLLLQVLIFFGYLLLFILVRKIDHIFNKVCHNRIKLGCVIGGDDRLARPGFNFLASVSGD